MDPESIKKVANYITEDPNERVYDDVVSEAISFKPKGRGAVITLRESVSKKGAVLPPRTIKADLVQKVTSPHGGRTVYIVGVKPDQVFLRSNSEPSSAKETSWTRSLPAFYQKSHWSWRNVDAGTRWEGAVDDEDYQNELLQEIGWPRKDFITIRKFRHVLVIGEKRVQNIQFI